jgi:hypothetical protein
MNDSRQRCKAAILDRLSTEGLSEFRAVVGSVALELELQELGGATGRPERGESDAEAAERAGASALVFAQVLCAAGELLVDRDLIALSGAMSDGENLEMIAIAPQGFQTLTELEPIDDLLVRFYNERAVSFQEVARFLDARGPLARAFVRNSIYRLMPSLKVVSPRVDGDRTKLTTILKSEF